MEKQRLYGHRLPSGDELGDQEKGGGFYSHHHRQDRVRKNRFVAQTQDALGIMTAVAGFLLTIYFVQQWVLPTPSLSTPTGMLIVLSAFGSGYLAATTNHDTTCTTVDGGYQCFSNISRLWGPHSPYFTVEKEDDISSTIPADCQITFVQVLSRHGARYPTVSMGAKLSDLVAEIKENATSLTGKYAFLENYTYTLGTKDLTVFGERQLVDSGLKFYHRYANLARNVVPFMRSSGEGRVVVSGEKFIEGFQHAKDRDSAAQHNQTAPVISVVFEEGEQFNNTLDRGTCTKLENSKLSHHVQVNFTKTFAPVIRHRLETDLPGVTLANRDIIYLMDMCTYDTLARTPDATELSPFCDIFTEKEWAKYDYLTSLMKYYSYGAGNPLGPSQGIGYANELIARLTQTPVNDHTSTNRTLDADPATFPLDRSLYADFSHDNVMVSIFFALGLYNGTQSPSLDTVESASDMNGFSAAWSVPFAARAYIEMMQCSTQREPLVRVLLNDRVVPLHGCQVDEMGRCKRDDFVRGLQFARSGGNWERCFS